MMRYSKFAVVPGDSLEAHTQNVMWMLEHQWGLVRPGALFSISGGMRADELHPLLAQILTQGLNAAVEQTDGWVVSSGLNAGVNRLFGTGLRASGEAAPCIGIPAWAAVSPETRSVLVNSLLRGDTAKMTSRTLNSDERASREEPALPTSLGEGSASVKSYDLEPHHSHFILVDGEKDPHASHASKFGSASKLRRLLEEHVHGEWQVPQLVLCLGSFKAGQLRTLQFITEKLRSGVPVIFVRETKGVASLVSRFMETLRPPHKLSLQAPHHKSRQKNVGVDIIPERAPVARQLIPWHVLFPLYRPSYFVAENVLKAASNGKGADPEVLSEVASHEPLSSRFSYEGAIVFDTEGFPLNPRGRTGMRGRGFLYKWGPNHASDPIVVRCLPGGQWQILAKRRAKSDTPGEWWALPGQLVDQHSWLGGHLRAFLHSEFGGDAHAEHVLQRLLRQLEGSLTTSLQDSDSSIHGGITTPTTPGARASGRASSVFSNSGGGGCGSGLAPADAGTSESSFTRAESSFTRSRQAIDAYERWGVYRGYVDDERNTDNAWIETTCMLLMIDERTTKHMLERQAESGGGSYSGGASNGFAWLDFCWKGDAEIGDPSEMPVAASFFPGHRDWMWVVRNFLAGGAQRNTLVSPEAYRFLRHGEMEEVERSGIDIADVLSHYVTPGGGGDAAVTRIQRLWRKLRGAVFSQRVYAYKDAFRELRHQLHKIASYRQLVTVFSVSLEDQSRWRQDRTCERGAEEFKEKCLHAMLDTYHYNHSTGGGGAVQGQAAAHSSSSGELSGSRGRAGCFAEEDTTPGLLQLLVRWGLPSEANRMLTEPEFASERSSLKLTRALQVVLERGDDEFLETLLSHADHRALTNGRYSPGTLIQRVHLTRLYRPDRVRRRDLVAKCDAFRLFHELRHQVQRDGRERLAGAGDDEMERFTEHLWWKHIIRQMRSFVDGYNFDKDPESIAAARRATLLKHGGGSRSVFGKGHSAGPLTPQRQGRLSGAGPPVRSMTPRSFRSVDTITFTDLFLWSIASGQPQLVMVLWGRVADPLRCGIVGVEACRRIRRRCFSRGRGKAQAKQLLLAIEQRLQDGLVGILDNIAKPRVARQILLETQSALGRKRGVGNLLALGTKLRSRELVTHDLSQGVLDDQWRGRDPKCGRIALKMDNLPPRSVLPRLVLVTLLGWSGLGNLFIPIVPNTYHPRSGEKRRRRTRLMRCCDSVVGTFDVYRIPSVKHLLGIFTAVARFIVSLPFALNDPESPLNVYDALVLVFLLSAALHEARQLHLLGGYEYWEGGFNQFDVAFLVVNLLGVILRCIAATLFSCAQHVPVVGGGVGVDGHNTTSLSYAACGNSSGVVDFSAPYAIASMDLSTPLSPAVFASPDAVDPFIYIYRMTMAIYAILQVQYLARLLAAFKPVGVLIEALVIMLYRVQIALVPYALVGIGSSVCFQLFESPDRWLLPWRRFIGADAEGTLGTNHPTLFLLMLVYTLAVDITILNLMIAIMTDTYFKVNRGLAVSNYRLSRVRLVNEFIHRAVVPQPLDTFLFVARALWMLLAALYSRLLCCGRRHSVNGGGAGSTGHGGSGSGHHPSVRAAANNFSDLAALLADGYNLPSASQRDEEINTEHWVARAQLEYLGSVRRREQKEAAEAAESERIVEIYDDVKRLEGTASDTSKLVLELRRLLLPIHLKIQDLENAAAGRSPPTLATVVTMETPRELPPN